MSLTHLFAVVFSNACVATALAVVVFAITRRVSQPFWVRTLWALVLIKLITPPIWQVPFADDADTKPLAVVTLPRPNAPDALSDPSMSVDRVVDAAAIGNHELAIHSNHPRHIVSFTRYATQDAIADDTSEPFTIHPEESTTIGGIPSDKRSDAIPIVASSPPRPSPSNAWTWLEGGAWLWLFATACWLAIAFLRIWRFRRILAAAPNAPRELADLAARVAARCGIAPPAVRVTDSTIPPMLWAFGHPTILLPEALIGTLSHEQIETLIAHECGHLWRRDHWWRIVEFMLFAAYWWHPVLWLARHQLHEAEEQCCDAFVLHRLPERARDYAHTLLATVDFLAEARPALPPAASGFGDANLMRRRFEMILENRPHRGLSWFKRSFVVALAFAVLPLTPLPAQNDDGEHRVIVIKDGDKTKEYEVSGEAAKDIDKAIRDILAKHDAEKKHDAIGAEVRALSKALADANVDKDKSVSRTVIIDADDDVREFDNAAATAIGDATTTVLSTGGGGASITANGKTIRGVVIDGDGKRHALPTGQTTSNGIIVESDGNVTVNGHSVGGSTSGGGGASGITVTGDGTVEIHGGRVSWTVTGGGVSTLSVGEDGKTRAHHSGTSKGNGHGDSASITIDQNGNVRTIHSGVIVLDDNDDAGVVVDETREHHAKFHSHAGTTRSAEASAGDVRVHTDENGNIAVRSNDDVIVVVRPDGTVRVRQSDKTIEVDAEGHTKTKARAKKKANKAKSQKKAPKGMLHLRHNAIGHGHGGLDLKLDFDIDVDVDGDGNVLRLRGHVDGDREHDDNTKAEHEDDAKVTHGVPVLKGLPTIGRLFSRRGRGIDARVEGLPHPDPIDSDHLNRLVEHLTKGLSKLEKRDFDFDAKKLPKLENLRIEFEALDGLGALKALDGLRVQRIELNKLHELKSIDLDALRNMKIDLDGLEIDFDALKEKIKETEKTDGKKTKKRDRRVI